MNPTSNEKQQEFTPEHVYRTLIVEDHVGSAKILAILFAKFGQKQVELAHCGRDAIEKAREFRPELIVLDLMLGDMSGLDVAKILRESQEFCETLIVALSGNASPEHRQQTTAAGFDLHLEKPISIDDVEAIINLRKK